MALMQEKPILCSIKPTVSLLVGDHKHDFFSGCKMFDVTFPNIINPEDDSFTREIGEISFKNFYVAQLTIRAKFRSADLDGQTGSLKWRTCVRKMKLMHNAHTEDGSHDYFTLTRKHFNFDIVNLSTLRFILHQPSPVWKDFKLEDIRFHRSPQISKNMGLPYWLTEEQKEEKPKDKKKLQGLPDLDVLSANLQELWSMAEEVSNNQSTVPLGRYEVDGCYDINLLSYT